MHMKVQFMELHGVTINILLLAVPIKNLKNGTLGEKIAEMFGAHENQK